MLSCQSSYTYYRVAIWVAAINNKGTEEQRWFWFLVQWKAALRCVSAYHTVSTEVSRPGVSLIEILMVEHERLYSSTRQISPGRGKVLRVRCDKRQVTLHKWEERHFGSSKGEWSRLLIWNLVVWLERGHREMYFYLTQRMSGYVAFNTYPFHMKLMESTKCANCDKRGRDDDACLTLFECPAFQLYQEDAMTTSQETGEQPLTTNSSPIMLKTELVQEQQRRPMADTTQHPMPDLKCWATCL